MPHTAAPNAPGRPRAAADERAREALLREAEAQRALAELFPHMQLDALRAIQDLFPLAQRSGHAANEAAAH